MTAPRTTNSSSASPSLPRIDAHLHLWNRAVSDYAWLTPELGAVYADWSAEQAAAELALAGISGAILVQAEDTLVDTEYLLGVATDNAWVLGVVGWVQLDDPAAAARDLGQWMRHPAFCGVRHLINDDARSDFLDLPAVRMSLRELSRNSIPFEIHDAWPRHLQQAELLAGDLPELTVIIDHLGKPPREGEEFVLWQDALTRLSAHPNTVAKLSGLHDSEGHFSWSHVRRVRDLALQLFGTERLMYGGNWPMTEQHGGYQSSWNTVSGLIDELSETEQMNILGGTAARVYRTSRKADQSD